MWKNKVCDCSWLRQACVNKVHPFFTVMSAEAEEVEVELGKSTNVEDMILCAIRESDATEKAKALLTDLIGNNSSDEVLTTYYKDMVSKAC